MIAILSACATVDCSAFAKNDPKRCKCVRDNGDYARAKKCSVIANEVYHKKARQQCLRTCYSLLDCGRCL